MSENVTFANAGVVLAGSLTTPDHGAASAGRPVTGLTRRWTTWRPTRPPRWTSCARPEVRGEAAGLFGHSEGGWVVLRAATLRDDVPWVVTNSGPGVTPAVQDRYSLATTLRRTGGITDDEVDAALAAYDPVPDAVRLRCPHLAVFGADDEVVPVADSVHLFTAAATAGRR
ncbi:alpha/beta hydrolase family protein [Saccharothrix xinjiangensis]|uniref:Alpha/beta hydrolase family protein n=1 Tax=Saccharothrix xinjiangensis TaxID=204798 RepID=A0ABV9Y7E4_9PSEU